jgi:general secretion pathway protein D
MRITLRWAVGLAGLLAAATLTPAAFAQGRPPRVVVFTNLSLQTTVTVPDGGTATVGGFSGLSEGRSEYGAPVLGRSPYASRGFRNVGYGRRAVDGRVSVRVRIINLREEEFRQTGFRSP